MLRGGAARKLRLKDKPSTFDRMTLLKRSPPEDEATARQWFEILSGRVSGKIFYLYTFKYVLNFSHCLADFSPAELEDLSEIPFVPVTSTEDKTIIRRLKPSQCFLGAAKSELYSKLFAFVDFGVRANVFLKACSTRQEPSIEDIAQVLIAEPRRIYELADSREK